MKVRDIREVTISEGDQNFTFEITKMPAMQQEIFITRLILFLSRSPELEKIDFSKFSTKDLNSKFIMSALGTITIEEMKPLLDELLSCCKYVKDGVKFACDETTLNGCFTSFQSIFKLRMEAIKLTFGFFTKDNKSEEDLVQFQAPKTKGM